ncbi:bifunctional hydroxymethylpyrimidine kinase/phosphomethylpyrimidine kinase [Aliarcobacter butzleri]|uniref:bifunctional hydroxymethylpyrimidine kinase/phosphomethylpyrimidine kinase n=1 Tax=Aliarcobacter butzleri TaxID=28197 RepID=UPI00022959E0|nr:bifunctional hydroxymethylpyrimidine kinase/phosphomethylpyrimidine kinase [Aliarcobacter butzleri]KLD96625.1 phosphomethylpyrimidine kinase [Aliarcobacter butzleri L349]MCG3652570.1 bifunctional hydroxymethylpyrimidine kinase/phosphomethylpyrimidine kinase [Aliarcobacter butzleri]MCT7569123.1 bifunctional hydroxymethylpyrimidine kinase/phosphomethylpyrimidine kinase [Aliarcobacter butzleri]MDN5101038.1 bifunctional hydroxymethylpyrimidine kinase/phosphomethylpyrimidine kinase [Aliarcobacter
MKVVLTIAGSDSGGGAGIQADIKSGFYHGIFMTTAITAITVQNTLGVTNVEVLKPSFVQEQISSVLEDFKVNAIKIGMLGSKELILKVLDCIKPLYIPIILDPVAISRAGSKLIDDEAIETLKTLFKYAFVITPNKYEAKLFFDVNSIDDIKNIKHIPTNILFKNMLEDKNKTVDILLKKDGTIINFESKRADESNTHGTGCSFSASIASLIAKGETLEDSIKIAKKYIYEAIKHAPNLGNGNGPINHILN